MLGWYDVGSQIERNVKPTAETSKLRREAKLVLDWSYFLPSACLGDGTAFSLQVVVLSTNDGDGVSD
jgi:hypothetical protein